MLVALALVGGLVFGVVLLLDGSPERDAPVTEASPEPSDAGSGASPGNSADDQVECWDGTTSAQEECPPVSGVEGMRWLFPDLDENFDKCTPGKVYGAKLRSIGCPVSTDNGRWARVVYSEWSSFEAGKDHYIQKYGPPDRTDPQFNIWLVSPVNGNAQTSRMFISGLPFSMTVAAPDGETASLAMRQTHFRPASETKPYR